MHNVSGGTQGKELKGKILHGNFSYKKRIVMIFLASNVILAALESCKYY